MKKNTNQLSDNDELVLEEVLFTMIMVVRKRNIPLHTQKQTSLSKDPKTWGRKLKYTKWGEGDMQSVFNFIKTIMLKEGGLMKKLYITFIAHLNELDVPALKMFVV